MSADPLPLPDGVPRLLPYRQLLAALREHGCAVLQAPPGSGKSTGVPLALHAAGETDRGRILMLQPRRVAARAVARRLAELLGEAPGETVGYRTRLDSRVGPATRIEVVTEGILTRRLQDDPELDGIAVVVFDEFHERSLQTDLGLALALDVRTGLRPDLRVLVMSATLDSASVAPLLDDAPVIHAAGTPFEVETVYLGDRTDIPPAQRVASAVERALAAHDGDLLAFLPGVREIRASAAALASRQLPDNTLVLELAGNLSAQAQDRAIAPEPGGRRKVVLATNLAETSLTIPGVRVVIDTGLARRPTFSPATGMSGLDTVRISRAAADQRRGRAGRTAPGVCYRLWSEATHRRLAADTPPEIADADLASLALELACWGDPHGSALRWLDAPPSASLARAHDLLHSLEATGRDGRVTAHGQSLSRAGAHPRLAHMIMRAARSGRLASACALAALLEERDLLAPDAADADIRARLARLAAHGANPAGPERRLLRAAALLARRAGAGFRARDVALDDAGPLLALAYPDRIGRRREPGSGRYALSGGPGAAFEHPDALQRSEYIVVAALDARSGDARIRLAAPLTLADVEAAHGARITVRDRVRWDARSEAVLALRERVLERLTLSEQRLAQPDAGAVLEAMLDGVRALGPSALPWTPELRAWRARVAFLRRHDTAAPSPWPDLSDDALAATPGDWLAPWLHGCSRRDHLSKVDLAAALRAQLPHPLPQRLPALAPTHLTVPSGSRRPLDYENDESPVLAVRLQEVFGLHRTPRICDGRVPLTMHLLSPAGRPVQVTRDLASFWASTYHDVRRELKGRYPRHYWPENPDEATATRRVRPRGG